MILSKRQPIIIYQVGKVGSSSVHHTLLNSGWSIHNCFHCHDLADAQDRVREIKSHWHIITMIRDPIARNISAFFFNINRPESEWYVGNIQQINTYNTKELLEIFLAKPTHKHNEPINWFDEQFKKYFNIDVYKESLPKNFIILRYEDIAEWNKKLSSWLGKEIIISHVHASKNQWYNQLYDLFLRQSIPKSYIEKMYNSRLVKRFYTDQEINKMTHRWSKSPR